MADAKTGRTTKMPATADYNVHKNKARKTCVSYKGGGSPTPANEYEHKFGPDTLAACDTWIENNCKDGGGTKCS